MNLAPEYQVTPDPIWSVAVARGDDGYERMEAARQYRWWPVPSWGSRGWDLGDWPLAVVFVRNTGDSYDLAENIEGDVTQWRFPTHQDRARIIDHIAHDWWEIRMLKSSDPTSVPDYVETVDPALPQLMPIRDISSPITN